ncbi:hypothetical protein JKP88DRAFT_151488, partial [Tribonema minus]
AVCTKAVTPALGLRACTEFVRGALLPRAAALSAPAPRTLVSGVTAAAKQRPQAVVEGLLVPLLHGDAAAGDGSAAAAGDSGAGVGDSSSGGRMAPGSAQCELLLRTARSALPPHAAAPLVAAACDPRCAWNDGTVALVTSLLGMKLVLDDSAVAALAGRIEAEAERAEQCKSLKFATLLHTLVLKYGPQAGPHAAVLRTAAEKNTTFMKKSALSALQRLKS